MALPTPDVVRDKSLTDQFGALSDGQVQGAIDEAALHYGSIAGIADYETIVALHAAHILAVQQSLESGGGVGPLQSVSLGPASKTWAVENIVAGAGVDESTPYGRRLVGLLRTLLPAVRTPRPVPNY
jgi:hypothetical protein